MITLTLIFSYSWNPEHGTESACDSVVVTLILALECLHHCWNLGGGDEPCGRRWKMVEDGNLNQDTLQYVCDIMSRRVGHVSSIASTRSRCPGRREPAFTMYWRTQLRATILFILIMTLLCSSCKRQFKNTQGLTKHRNTCAKARPKLTRILQQQEARLEQKRAAKIARRQGNDVSEEGAALATEVSLKIHNFYVGYNSGCAGGYQRA